MKQVLIILLMAGILLFSGCINSEVPGKSNVKVNDTAKETKTNETQDNKFTAPNITDNETKKELETPEPTECPYECCIDNNYTKKDCAEAKICENNICKSKTPVDNLSDELIQTWGADCTDKGAKEMIAQCILNWQESNFYWCYTHPETNVIPDAFEIGYPDCVVDMQFNQMNLGSFPVSKVMELKVKNKKVFGACYTYATTYCAVARWNGLDCRVISAGDPDMESNQDLGAGYCGLASKDYIEKLGLNCDEWKGKGWKMQAWHYWAEVLINGQWKRMETSVGEYKADTKKYIIDAGMNYTVLDW